MSCLKLEGLPGPETVSQPGVTRAELIKLQTQLSYQLSLSHFSLGHGERQENDIIYYTALLLG